MHTRLDAAIVSAARDAAGADATLLGDAGTSDAHWPHGLKRAIRTAEMLTDYEVVWFEEALRPDAIDDFVALRADTQIPVAGGEVLTRR
jgi:D-galactarolactone cycloisomerase